MKAKIRKIFIHIGYPKTATTTLQKFLFPKHPEMFDIRDYENEEKWIYDLLYLNEISFRKKIDYHKRGLKDKIDSTDRDTIIYSNESILSNSLFFAEKPRPLVRYLDPSSTARKAHMLFSELTPEPKIIIVIRNQLDLIKSIYAQMYNYCFKNYKQTRNFRIYTDNLIRDGARSFTLSALSYYDVIKEYEKIFGVNNVYILVYEELKNSPAHFFQKLESIMGLSRETAYNYINSKNENKKSCMGKYRTDSRSLLFHLGRLKKRFFGDINIPFADNLGILNNIEIPGKTLNSIKYRDEDFEKLMKFFDENNRLLAEEYALNLEKYGYFKR
ncbi:MAG: sulfotransferase domain-containing protein [Candidatus Krumholzibacteriota bacterium]|nr:sulfotransferase domain-containing protein [Candidatus Krumholzibacteriota bacterium]